MTTITANTVAKPCISYLCDVFTPSSGKPTLHQAKITAMKFYESFDEFIQNFWQECAYPNPQAHKFETFSWVPTVFQESMWVPKSRPDAQPKMGYWRSGEHSAHAVTVMYADLDNQHEDRAYITFEQIGQDLENLGVSHALYTSFSHKPERHKVRIMMPISRTMTYDEAFRVFVWFNERWERQLDGSIYDDGDHLYGPTFTGQRHEWLGGKALDVDVILSLVPALSDEALMPMRRMKEVGRSKRDLTPDEVADLKAKVADTSVALGVTIDNPAYFNPVWLELLDNLYNGGSHRQTLFGVLSRVWLKSKRNLSFGELLALQGEMDARWGFYCQRHYGSHALQSDVRSVMALTGADPISLPTPGDLKQARIKRERARLARRR